MYAVLQGGCRVMWDANDRTLSDLVAISYLAVSCDASRDVFNVRSSPSAFYFSFVMDKRDATYSIVVYLLWWKVPPRGP